MSNSLWNLFAAAKPTAEESDFDTVTEWAAAHIEELEAKLAEYEQTARNYSQMCADAEAKLTRVVTWLESRQPDVFARGLWDVIEGDK